MTSAHLTQLKSKYVARLAAIRPNAVNLVDSFDLRDEVIGSALGCWDGNAYQSTKIIQPIIVRPEIDGFFVFVLNRAFR